MTKEFKAIIADMVTEYELLAKYNGGKDYLRWNALQVALTDLEDYLKAIIDDDFLYMNYGITDIDIQFVSTFNPDQLIKDYKEWKEAADEQSN